MLSLLETIESFYHQAIKLGLPYFNCTLYGVRVSERYIHVGKIVLIKGRERLRHRNLVLSLCFVETFSTRLRNDLLLHWPSRESVRTIILSLSRPCRLALMKNLYIRCH